MKLRLPGCVQGLFEPKRDLPMLAAGGAWLFAVGSLFPLAWLVWFSGGGLLGAGYVFNTSINGHNISMPLLSYSGVSGFLLIWSQLLLVSAAILLTAFPRYVPSRWRRLGHGVLVGWNALWAVGAWRLALVDSSFLVQATFITVLLGCTACRAWSNWRPGRGSAAPTVEAVPPSREEPSPNYFSDETEQPPTGTARQQIMQALERGRKSAVAASRKAVVALKAGVNAARDNSAKT